MNAFEMITLSQGLNLSPLFDRHQVLYQFHLLALKSHGHFCLDVGGHYRVSDFKLVLV